VLLAQVQVTSELFWAATLVAALVDVGLVVPLAWHIKPNRFRQLKWPLALAATLVFGLLWTWAMWGAAWELAMRYLFPTWARGAVPPTYGLLYGAVGLGIWWLALRLAGNPVLSFLLLGGLSSLPGHLWAFYGRGMLEKVPMLRGVSVAAMLVFGIFEFIIYWSLILIIAILFRRGWERWTHTAKTQAPVTTC